MNPTNNMTCKEAVPRRELEHNTHFHKSQEESSENGIQSVKANSDREIYKFFSNSAPHNDCSINHYNQHPVGFNTMPIIEPQMRHVFTTNNSEQQCNHCRRLVPLCGSCCHDNPSYYSCYRCNVLQNMDVCNNCRRVWVQSWNHNRDHTHVEHCGRNNYPRDGRPQILEITYQDHSSQTRSSSPYNYKADISKSTHSDMNANALTYKIQNDNHSSSTNFDKNIRMETKSSHVPDVTNLAENPFLSKDEEILELKRKNDILIARHARNYGSLRKRKPISFEIETNQKYSDDSFPLPLMREQLTASRDVGKGKFRQNSQAVRKLEYKWEVRLSGISKEN